MEKAIICIAIGKDSYDAEVRNLIRTVRENGGNCADTKIILYTDRDDRQADDDNVLVMPLPIEPKFNGSARLAHRLAKTLIYSNMPCDKAIFVDTDVECWSDFSDLWEYCDDNIQHGIPDGRTPDPLDMIANLTFPCKQHYEHAKLVFGGKYIDAEDKPTAWNVGVLPMSKQMGSKIGPEVHSTLMFLGTELKGDIWKAFTSNFDEQVPLNYSLWRCHIPTRDIDVKYNMTKMPVVNRLREPNEVVFLHLRHIGNKTNSSVYNKFLAGS